MKLRHTMFLPWSNQTFWFSFLYPSTLPGNSGRYLKISYLKKPEPLVFLEKKKERDNIYITNPAHGGCFWVFLPDDFSFWVYFNDSSTLTNGKWRRMKMLNQIWVLNMLKGKWLSLFLFCRLLVAVDTLKSISSTT